MSMNSFQLKGGGWYATDYAKKPDKSQAPAKPAEKAAGDSAPAGAEKASAPAAPAKDKPSSAA
jgi:hypothetical protein